MNAVGTYPPAPPEHTATACQIAVGRRLGEIAAIAGAPNPTAEHLAMVPALLDAIKSDLKRWTSAIHLTGAARHTVSRAEIDRALGRVS